MEMIVLWVALSIACGIFATRLDRGGFAWFVLSAFLSPLIGALLLLALGRSGKKCPQCAETVKLDASVCRHCGHAFVEGEQVTAT